MRAPTACGNWSRAPRRRASSLSTPRRSPTTWEDLLDPKWKGKLGIEQEDSDWLAGLFAEIGEAKGIKLFKEIVAKNGMSVRKGHTLLTQLVVSGEVPLALTVYN